MISAAIWHWQLPRTNLYRFLKSNLLTKRRVCQIKRFQVEVVSNLFRAALKKFLFFTSCGIYDFLLPTGQHSLSKVVWSMFNDGSKVGKSKLKYDNIVFNHTQHLTGRPQNQEDLNFKSIEFFLTSFIKYDFHQIISAENYHK